MPMQKTNICIGIAVRIKQMLIQQIKTITAYSFSCEWNCWKLIYTYLGGVIQSNVRLDKGLSRVSEITQTCLASKKPHKNISCWKLSYIGLNAVSYTSSTHAYFRAPFQNNLNTYTVSFESAKPTTLQTKTVKASTATSRRRVEKK